MNEYSVFPHEDGSYKDRVRHIELAYAPHTALLATFEIASLLGVGWGYAPALPNRGDLMSAPPVGARGRALHRRDTVETTHATMRIVFHRATHLCEIEPCHAAQPFHRNFFLAIGPLDRLQAHAQFRRRFLHREQLLLHARSFCRNAC